MWKIASVTLLIALPAYSQGVSAGSGYSNSSGNGNGSGNGKGNDLKIELNLDCFFCSGIWLKKTSCLFKWHPPMVQQNCQLVKK